MYEYLQTLAVLLYVLTNPVMLCQYLGFLIVELCYRATPLEIIGAALSLVLIIVGIVFMKKKHLITKKMLS